MNKIEPIHLMNYFNRSLFFPITIICLVTFLLSYLNENISAFIGIFIACWLFLRAKPDAIIGLFILYLIKYNFYILADISSMSAMNDRELIRDVLVIAGFPVNVPTLACGFITIRVFWEIFQSPKTFYGKVPKIILNLWLIAFIPALIGFFWGYILHNENWTRGLRFLMISGSFFYGFIFVKNWPKEGSRVLIKLLIPFVTVMLFLMNFAIYWSHHGFLFIAIGGAFSFYLLFLNGINNKILGFILLILVLRYSILSSITIIGIGILSIVFSFFANVHKIGGKKIGNKILKAIPNLLLIFSLIFTFSIAYLGYYLDISFFNIDSSEFTSFSDRVIYKTIADRLPFWFAAFEQIVSGPYLIVPSGRILFVNTVFYGMDYEWIVGAHNVFLESIRNTGLFVGLIIISIYIFALKENINVIVKSNDKILKTLSAAILGVGLSGMTTGDFPGDMTVGFFIWSLAGVSSGLYLNSKPNQINI